MKPVRPIGDAKHDRGKHLDAGVLSTGSVVDTDGKIYCRICGVEMEEMPDTITCPKCGRQSHNLNDIRERYCGNCHQYHDTMGGTMPTEVVLQEIKDCALLARRHIIHPNKLPDEILRLIYAWEDQHAPL